MRGSTQLLLGTRKGAFILESDADRGQWAVRGPFCENWPIHHFVRTADGTLYAAGGNAWYGPSVFRSDDEGVTWTQSSRGLTYGEGEPKVDAIWNLTAFGDTMFAGVEPAGLFRSEDRGQTWSHVSGLRDHPSRSDWQPGAGGLILHSIAPHPTDSDRMWVAISAAGTFETVDGGVSWVPRNRGVRADFFPGPPPEVGHCVHNLRLDPADPERLFQQNHCGVYVSEDGAANWTEITAGLPSEFGFPLAIHPHDPSTIWVVPHEGPENGRHMIGGAAAVWRSRDRGQSWQRVAEGLPQQHAYLTVLREAMAVDRHERVGVYIGTNTGQVFASADEGDHWQLAADFLPPIWSVEAVVRDD
jgi:hypothetical protein